ncbi:helix-turn-helix transcriptional regulator [Pseudonocardia humida]|uniref:AAA family ATPase n=1 Tax=Pseudonocardia humida TaxID=2800819 RepID=A0ABT0ZWF9_9PSEU|nr:LuxR family transcriptional regulator [Pseudonocardia humida]MCO1655010.1 AAA family ATPase [Pseudonocardia humida]
MRPVGRLGVGIELVGRHVEVKALAAALERAAVGRPTGVLLAGDAGVGKSRLVAEASERAAAAGFTVLVGRCLDTGESALPYLPFTEIVGALAAARPELVAEHTALRHLLPGGFRRTEQRPGEHRELGQLQVFDAVLSALADLTSTDPALVVVEDLHWADRSSRDLLVFLLSRLTGQRLVVLATYRSDDLHRRHPLRGVLSELVRLPAVERLDLSPLDQTEALRLVRLLAAGTLSEAALHTAARRSEGNAFFAEELVSASADGMPHGLAEVLVARVEGLPPATQRVLRIASVAGRRVRHDQLAAVSGLDVDELEQALRDAATHHVLVAEESSPTSGDTYLFRHELLREAIYHELLPGERSRLHAAYAALLAELPPGTGNRAAELAHHAMAGHDLPLALAASVQAANEANEREAPAEMLQHAERAIELWSAVPDAERVAGVDEGTLTRWAAWGASATGDPDRGIALGRRALELAEERGDPFLTSSIARRYTLRLLELAGREREALAAAERALAVVADKPPGEHLAWAHAVLARTLLRLDRLTDAAREARAVLDVTGTMPDEASAMASAKAYALTVLASCDEYNGDAESARARLRKAKPLARSSGNLSVELRVYYIGGISLLDAGRLDEAVDEFAAGEARAAATGLTWSADGLDLRVAHVIARFLRGDWDSAEAAAEIAGESVSAVVATRLSAAGMLPAVARGRFEPAERRLAELREFESVDEQVILFVGQAGGEAALWQGRPERAAELLSQALDALASGPFADFAPQLGRIMLDSLAIGAEADLVAVGRKPVAEATRAARALLADAERTARDGMPRAGELGPEGLAWLCRARAELTRVEGRSDPQAWSEVVEAFGYEAGAPGTAPGPPRGYRQAQALLRRAEARLAAGAAHAAAGPVEADLRTALEIAERLGAGPLERAVLAMAERAGLRLRDAEPARPTGPDPLTPRERSVLALVAEGGTNRQVGQALFISEKTVSVHLSRVMAKLGAASRTEAVTIAYSRGLLTAPRVGG